MAKFFDIMQVIKRAHKENLSGLHHEDGSCEACIEDFHVVSSYIEQGERTQVVEHIMEEGIEKKNEAIKKFPVYEATMEMPSKPGQVISGPLTSGNTGSSLTLSYFTPGDALIPSSLSTPLLSSMPKFTMPPDDKKVIDFAKRTLKPYGVILPRGSKPALISNGQPNSHTGYFTVHIAPDIRSTALLCGRSFDSRSKLTAMDTSTQVFCQRCIKFIYKLEEGVEFW